MAEGAEDFLAALDALDERITALITKALATAMEHVRGVAAGLTPVETGHLVGSASVTAVALEAQLLYPGPYARNQHYSLDFKHTHGQALFLEQPMITEAPYVFKIIADMLGEAF